MALGDGANHVVPRRQRRRRRGRIEFIPRSEAIIQMQSLFVGMEISVSGEDDSFNEVILRLPLDEKGQSPKDIVIPVPSDIVFDNTSSEFSGSFEEIFTVEECAVLSTCARLNVILVLKTVPSERADKAPRGTKDNTKEVAQTIASSYAVACTLLRQMKQSSQLQSTTQEQRQIQMLQLSDQLTNLEGAHAISSHLCLVASGLTPRPDRPDSDAVVFRPYSSHDSHILMQLKRAVEIISVQGAANNKERDGNASKNNNGRQKQRRKNSKSRRPTTSQGRNNQARKKVGSLGSPSRGRIKALLDGALRAGKMVRNENIVPEIVPLKNYTSDDAMPPDDLRIPAVEAAMKHAITPSVASCVERLEVLERDASKQISTMRKRVNSFVDTLMEPINDVHAIYCNYNELKRLANKLLHEPTMQLRRGKLSDVGIEDSIAKIERELTQYVVQERKTVDRMVQCQ